MTSINAVFLDTSVFDSFNYNYDAPTLIAFVEACKEENIILVTPDPIEREIKRHLQSRVGDALALLRNVRKKAPFLHSWKHFPSVDVDGYVLWDMRRRAIKEWNDFKKKLSGITLDYSNVKIEKIMDWYDTVVAPFGAGKKSKEFPDAFAVAILEQYARKEGVFIAVVSFDTDFKKSCDRYTSLLYFYSLRSLTENILEESKSIDAFRCLIQEATEFLESAIEEEAGSIDVDHDDFNLDAELNSIQGAYVTDFSIIAVGQFDCTIAFEADVDLNVSLDAAWGDDWQEIYGDIGRDFDCSSSFTGVATVKFNDALSEVNEVPTVDFDDAELIVSVDPME